jgi:hypothetical protein
MLHALLRFSILPQQNVINMLVYDTHEVKMRREDKCGREIYGRTGSCAVFYNHASAATAPANTAPMALRLRLRLSAAPVVEGVALPLAPPCVPDAPLVLLPWLPVPVPVAVALKLPDVGVPLKSCCWPSVGRGDVGLTSQKPLV